LTVVSQPSLVELVARELHKLIVSGDLRPGERLIEERLTERFGVSRPPLREALRILEQDGLVQRLPRRGAIVTRLSADDVLEIYSLRWALERLALELSMPVEDLDRLSPMRDAIASMREAPDREALLEANWRFHYALVSLPGHRRLLDSYRSLLSQLQLCMAINLRVREQVTADPADSALRHERLLQLIEVGDLPAVLREIETHGDRSFLGRLDDFVTC
jgi:DNA-binding GntR family transcriptional regulator